MERLPARFLLPGRTARIVRFSLRPISVLAGLMLGSLLAFSITASTSVGALAAAGRFAGHAAPAQRVDFFVHLPLRNKVELQTLTRLQATRNSPMYHHWLTPAQVKARYGPTQADIASAVAALRGEGFSIVRQGVYSIHVAGTAAVVERAFGTRVGMFRGLRAVHPVVEGAMRLPAALARLNPTVLGLTSFAELRPHSTRVKPRPGRQFPGNRYGNWGGYWFTDLKQAYAYPSYAVTTGAGRKIATVGYSDFSSSDAALYFGHECLGAPVSPCVSSQGPEPTLQHLLIPGYAPFSASSGISAEANLDTQMAGGSAPGATIIGVATPPIAGESFFEAYS